MAEWSAPISTPPTCLCAKCPNVVPRDHTFCHLCRENMQVSVISLQPAKMHLVCLHCHDTTTLEDS